ncbi:sugar ABC transporter substrate-binding protein [Kibdelosporangium aridum]|uniref:Sugar ABC transporter substrate-binding protein n=1 Tax=Kibdelosporangium aridum TaxID=2030 RepID=A0A428YRH9_KIBAR|nr:sugar ABC transporter substrate-binding protein [Kibdelosporangium aridum]
MGLAALTACSTRGSNAGPANSGPEKKPVTQVKVALVPGGPHQYFQPWKAAAERAKADFGLGETAFDETSQWDQAKQNSVINSLASQGYNAFGVFGASPTDINSTFSDLKAKGLSVASLGSCPAGDVDKADFCLSTDVGEAAYKAAKATIDAMGGQGSLVHLTGNNVDSNTQRRIAGVKKAIDETAAKVVLANTVTDVDKDLQTAQKAVADLLSAQGKAINGIVTTAYNPAVAAAAGVKSAGLPIKVVAIDDDPQILAGIKDGSVAATIAQNPTGQAYLGAWALSQLATGACTMKQPGQVIDSGSFTVTTSNVDSYDGERKAKTDQLKTEFSGNVLLCS